MGVASEIGNDFMLMLVSLGILFGIVFLFWIWSTGGTWILVSILVIAILLFGLYKAYAGGYINI